MKFRKLLAAHVLNDEVVFRGGGVQRESEWFDVSLHVPAPPPLELCLESGVHAWGLNTPRRIAITPAVLLGPQLRLSLKSPSESP